MAGFVHRFRKFLSDFAGTRVWIVNSDGSNCAYTLVLFLAVDLDPLKITYGDTCMNHVNNLCPWV